MNHKNVIVCLSRGYSDLLLNRNMQIYNHINGKFNTNYTLIIFHEGNISTYEQQKISNYTPEQTIEFVDISDTWSGGYEAMCKFYMYDIWNYCSKYDHVLRIDDDCFLREVDKDPFDCLDDNECATVTLWGENHGPTNSTLPFFIRDITGVPIEEFYNDQFPYTNVFLSRVSFWLDPKMNDILKQIALSPLQRNYRWGDLPVLGSLLNIYAPNKIGKLEYLSYYHESHQVLIKPKVK